MGFLTHLLAIAIITIPTFVILYTVGPHDPYNGSKINLILQSIFYASIIYFIVYIIKSKPELFNSLNSINFGDLKISFN